MQSDESDSSPSPTEAPEHPLPSTPLFSVEYPGYVRPASIPLAINNLGGQSSLHNAFKRTATKTDALLELRLRPDNPFAHPVPGDVVGTSNVLLKVVKRKRRRVEGQSEQDVPVGEYTAEAVGVVSKTVRFRSGSSFGVSLCALCLRVVVQAW
jgi:general transcription factor 3C polypeptide 5 (transcription factor C subunit 1)